MPSIAVVLSAYNGEKYIREQIDSILEQDLNPDDRLTLFIRDDGSSDDTVEVLQPYAAMPNVHIVSGVNKGVVRSFMALIQAVPDDFDYIALSDQDDKWLPDKISRAIALLSKQNAAIPQLYCSEYYFCDENLGSQKASHLNRIGISFSNMFYENVASGNTMMFNRTLARLLKQAKPSEIYCHDWWIALVASAFGNVIFDSYPCLYYRRLASSVSPTGSSGLALLRYRFNTFFKSGELDDIKRQLRYFKRSFDSELTDDQRSLLDLYVTGSRFAKALHPFRLRQTLRAELAVRTLLLLGLL